MRFIILSTLFVTIFCACAGKSEKSSQFQIEESVKSYLFLPDSSLVEAEITDTLRTDELEKLLEQVEKNLSLINQDLDTLSIMIDDRSYKILDYRKMVEETSLLRKAKYKDSLLSMEREVLELQLKQAKLTEKRVGFKQTNRILLHLKRSVWADIAGFDVNVKYGSAEEQVELELLLDANFEVVD